MRFNVDLIACVYKLMNEWMHEIQRYNYDAVIGH